MEKKDKTNHMCHKCNNPYDVFDRRPKLLRCLHNVCEHCYYGNKIKKDLQICPKCKDVSGGEVDSHIDCVTINQMVIQTLQEAFGGTGPYSTDGAKKGSHSNDIGSKTVDGSVKGTGCNMSVFNCSSSDSGYDLIGDNASSVELINDCGDEEKEETNDSLAAKDDKSNSKSFKGLSWFDELFHSNSKEMHSDSEGCSKDSATKQTTPDSAIEYANCTAERNYDSSTVYPYTQVKHNGNDIGMDTANHLNDMSTFPNTCVKPIGGNTGMDGTNDTNETTKDVVCSTKHHRDFAVSYCPDCHLFLCPRCQTKHFDDLLSMYHRCYSIDVLREVPVYELDSNAHCVLHPEHALNYFCQHHACKKLACIKCATNLHVKHGKSSIEEAVALEKTNLNERLQEIEKILSQDRDGNSLTSESYGDSGQDKIFQTLLEVTEKRKTELLNEVDKYYMNHDVIAAHLIELQYTKYYCDMALAYTTKTELLEVCHVIHAWAEHLLKTDIPLDKNPRDTMIFVDETQTDIIHEIEGLVSGLNIGNRRRRKSTKGKRKPEESVC